MASAPTAVAQFMPFITKPTMPKTWITTVPAIAAPNKAAARHRLRTANVASKPITAAPKMKPTM